MRHTFEIPLDIPDVTIAAVTTNRVGRIEITVQSTIEGTPCHQCGQMTTKFYDKDRAIIVYSNNSPPLLIVTMTPLDYMVPRSKGAWYFTDVY